MADEITIRVPATTPHLALVRATATALASLIQFSYDEIMDLHIGIDEACSRLMATADDPKTIAVSFTLDAGDLVVSATADGPTREDRKLLNPWSEKILGSVFDEFNEVLIDGKTSMTLTKRGSAG